MSSKNQFNELIRIWLKKYSLVRRARDRAWLQNDTLALWLKPSGADAGSRSRQDYLGLVNKLFSLELSKVESSKL